MAKGRLGKHFKMYIRRDFTCVFEPLSVVHDAVVLVQPEMEKRRSPLVSIPPFGRVFKAWGLSIRWRLAAQERVITPPSIVSMSPPGYPSAWLRPRSARFRFARQDHCSSATTCLVLNNPFVPKLDSGS